MKAFPLVKTTEMSPLVSWKDKINSRICHCRGKFNIFRSFNVKVDHNMYRQTTFNWCLSHFTTVMRQIIVCVIVKATNILLVNCVVNEMNFYFLTQPEILHVRDFETNLPFQTLKNSKKLLDQEKGIYTSTLDEEA